MGLFKRIFGILGLSKYEPHESRDHDDGDDADSDDGTLPGYVNRTTVEPIPGAPRRGFSVPVQVAVERPNLGPLIVPCNGDGGVQETFLKRRRGENPYKVEMEEEWTRRMGRESKNGRRSLFQCLLFYMGLKWYAKRLRIDEDGDVADEFLDQVSNDAAHTIEGEPKSLPKFQVKYTTQPVKGGIDVGMIETLLKPPEKMSFMLVMEYVVGNYHCVSSSSAFTATVSEL
ncbi:hypothetical protein V2J09_014812 [Rumex salicifolius]